MSRRVESVFKQVEKDFKKRIDEVGKESSGDRDDFYYYDGYRDGMLEALKTIKSLLKNLLR